MTNPAFNSAASAETGNYGPVPVGANTSNNQLGVSMATSVFTTAVAGYASYRLAKHAEAMRVINYNLNKEMTLVSLRVNQYLGAVNRLDLLKSTAGQKQEIQKETLKAIGSAEVAQAAVGQQGGSAQQVLFDIKRTAANLEDARVSELDDNLLALQVQQFGAESNALQQIGIKSAGRVSSSLAVGSAAAEMASQIRDITREQPIQSS